MGYTRQDRISTEVLRRALATGTEVLMIKAQLRWVGHVIRMDNLRLPRVIFLSELALGTRKVGAPVKHYKDTLRSSLQSCNIPMMGWENLARDRSIWRYGVQEGVSTFEKQRLLNMQRQKQKESIPNTNEAVALLRNQYLNTPVLLPR